MIENAKNLEVKVMPGKVKVRIISARGLPVMDRSSDLADAFAEVEIVTNVFIRE